MAKELSELLTDLSEQAKKVEDSFAAIAAETDAAAEARREHTRAAATAAVDKLDQSATAAGDTVAGHWHALQARIDEEIKGVQAGIADHQHARDIDHAEHQAEAAKARAEQAIALAAAAVQTAGAAVLDAAVAQRHVDAVKRQ